MSTRNVSFRFFWYGADPVRAGSDDTIEVEMEVEAT